MKAAMGDAEAYQYATIYAQWGDQAKALDWLETALRLRDSGLEHLKADPLLDPVRQEPRFQAIERKIKFPPPLVAVATVFSDSKGMTLRARQSSGDRYLFRGPL